MGAQLFESVHRVFSAHTLGSAPDPRDLELVQAHAAAASGGLDPNRIANSDDIELDAVFRASSTLGIETMLNSGERRIDIARGEIYNDAHWKGYLPKGLPLGEVASRIHTGYFKRFWKDGDRYLGETRYVDGRIPLNHSLEEIVIEQRTNDLEPGRYILLRYTDPVFEHLFYDTMRIVSPDLVLYRGYTGRFPDGRRGWTAPLLRRYKFPQMDSADHRELFRAGRVPNREELQGSWRMDLVADSNHATGVALLHVKLNPDGALESRYERKGLLGGLPMPPFAQRHFRTKNFTSLPDEVRAIGDGFLVGRFLADVPGRVLDRFLGTSSFGLFQVEKNGSGNGRAGFYYLLSRVE